MKTKDTKAERHEIYKKALNILENKREKCFGICAAIYEADRKIYIDHLEEFNVIKPENFIGGFFSPFWSDFGLVDLFCDSTEGHKRRLILLQFMIEMTKPN